MRLERSCHALPSSPKLPSAFERTQGAQRPGGSRERLMERLEVDAAQQPAAGNSASSYQQPKRGCSARWRLSTGIAQPLAGARHLSFLEGNGRFGALKTPKNFRLARRARGALRRLARLRRAKRDPVVLTLVR